jgi:hypothetical protein
MKHIDWAVQLFVLTPVVAFAGYRLARAVSVDDITKECRDLLYRWTYETGEPPKNYRRFLVDLIGCPICTGWWITITIGLICSSQLIDGPLVLHLLLAVSAAGGQCWLTLRESR